MEINLGKGWGVAEQNVVCDEEKGREQWKDARKLRSQKKPVCRAVLGKKVDALLSPPDWSNSVSFVVDMLWRQRSSSVPLHICVSVARPTTPTTSSSSSRPRTPVMSPAPNRSWRGIGWHMRRCPGQALLVHEASISRQTKSNWSPK
ncbi:hypothetical protein PILCRDRAFT_5545 [Piloderma croceum F 1598]|uniref:Uncharacterized protein n=1 Tax=Piloderma croceum (strain F 1598) TaxID=765440 RepID=A0A0C3C6C4_PILCF|nr:hypothetical protein PILCRDRAFT_5545 [Piloderma croceum F 1598]